MNLLSFVDRNAIEPGCTILMHHKQMSVVGLLGDDVDPLVSLLRLLLSCRYLYCATMGHVVRLVSIYVGIESFSL